MTDGRRLRVAVVDTSSRRRPGSMRRYADLVAEAATSVEDGQALEVLRISLAPPPGLSAALPARLEPWGRRFWAKLRPASWWGKQQIDLVHVTDAMSGLPLRVPNVPMVATVHDLIPMLQMDGRWGPRPPSRFARRTIRRVMTALRELPVVAADSVCTARDLSSFAGVAAERISVIPLAVPRPFLAETLIGHAVAAVPFLLHVGSNAFYKNRSGLLRIFSRVRRHARIRLVLAGVPPDEPLLRLASELGVSAHIDVHAHPTDETLAGLYRHASALIMPSLYEGYGWPVLEAMGMGCPVVCSSAGALPEVSGEAALRCPPEDEDGLAAAVLEVLESAPLAERLRRGGRAQAAANGVANMGRRLNELYRRAAGV
jgi:glycosyltransferase involved in cell wall biosynthesis